LKFLCIPVCAHSLLALQKLSSVNDIPRFAHYLSILPASELVRPFPVPLHVRQLLVKIRISPIHCRFKNAPIDAIQSARWQPFRLPRSDASKALQATI
jgi:hypothetical protein